MPTSSHARTSPVCSAKGCRAPAAWALQWNNPRLHEPNRRKTWMACERHRAGLGEFLAKRGFLRETVPAARVIDLDGAAARDASLPAAPATTVVTPSAAL